MIVIRDSHIYTLGDGYRAGVGHWIQSKAPGTYRRTHCARLVARDSPSIDSIKQSNIILRLLQMPVLDRASRQRFGVSNRIENCEPIMTLSSTMAIRWDVIRCFYYYIVGQY